jgi:hypothetical protein
VTAYGCAPTGYTVSVLTTYIEGYNFTSTPAAYSSISSTLLAGISVATTGVIVTKSAVNGGAIAAAVLSAVFGLLLLGVVAWILLRRRSKGKAKPPGEMAALPPLSPPYPHVPTEMDHSRSDSETTHWELATVPSTPPEKEIPRDEKDPEITVHELPGRRMSVLAPSFTSSHPSQRTHRHEPEPEKDGYFSEDDVPTDNKGHEGISPVTVSPTSASPLEMSPRDLSPRE